MPKRTKTKAKASALGAAAADADATVIDGEPITAEDVEGFRSLSSIRQEE